MRIFVNVADVAWEVGAIVCGEFTLLFSFKMIQSEVNSSADISARWQPTKIFTYTFLHKRFCEKNVLKT